jgi:hypothetical protein
MTKVMAAMSAFADVIERKVKHVKSQQELSARPLNEDERDDESDNEAMSDDEQLSADDVVCRICLEQVDPNDPQVFHPCACAGTMKFVHNACQMHWMKVKRETDMRNCGLCSEPMSFQLVRPSFLASARAALAEVRLSRYSNAWSHVVTQTFQNRINVKSCDHMSCFFLRWAVLTVVCAATAATLHLALIVSAMNDISFGQMMDLSAATMMLISYHTSFAYLVDAIKANELSPRITSFPGVIVLYLVPALIAYGCQSLVANFVFDGGAGFRVVRSLLLLTIAGVTCEVVQTALYVHFKLRMFQRQAEVVSLRNRPDNENAAARQR